MQTKLVILTMILIDEFKLSQNLFLTYSFKNVFIYTIEHIKIGIQLLSIFKNPNKSRMFYLLRY